MDIQATVISNDFSNLNMVYLVCIFFCVIVLEHILNDELNFKLGVKVNFENTFKTFLNFKVDKGILALENGTVHCFNCLFSFPFQRMKLVTIFPLFMIFL